MNSLNKTFLPNQKYNKRNWLIIDCKGQKVGRVASVISHVLKGKNKPDYYPSIDMGDYVILLNAELIITNKNSKHFIVNKPGRPGRALKIRSVSDSLVKVTIERAVKGMLAETETKRLLRRLKIYLSEDHPHYAQNPIEINISSSKL